MAMRALETERMIGVGQRPSIRQVDIFSEEEEPTSIKLNDMHGFMDTFDQAVTVGNDEWDVWVKRNKVDQRRVGNEEAIMMSYLGLSPFMKDPFNRGALIEGTYDVSCHVHGSEQGYLDFLFFLLSVDE